MVELTDTGTHLEVEVGCIITLMPIIQLELLRRLTRSAGLIGWLFDYGVVEPFGALSIFWRALRIFLQLIWSPAQINLSLRQPFVLDRLLRCQLHKVTR